MSNMATVNGGVIVTIPSNGIWNGEITLSAALAVAPGGSGGTFYPSVILNGAGRDWTDGDTVVAVALASGAVGAGATTGTSAAATQRSGVINIQSLGAPITLTLSIAPGVSAVAVARGAVQAAK